MVKKKHHYTASELLKHLCEIVIPLEDINEVPKQAPIKLPTRPDNFTLGTKSADLIQLDNGALAREERIRLNDAWLWGSTDGDAANKLGN